MEKRFVVQQHEPKYEARGLHWDLRIEMDGVLKTWALAKEPVKASKTIVAADQIEDKELDYINFQGVIPEGQPGTGLVTIWDQGTYALRAREPDHISFMFKGSRLKGIYVLRRQEGKKWLLTKE